MNQPQGLNSPLPFFLSDFAQTTFLTLPSMEAAGACKKYIFLDQCIGFSHLASITVTYIALTKI